MIKMSLIISIIALAVSCIVGFFQAKAANQRNFGLKMQFKEGCCFYIPPLDPSNGHTASLIARARIINNSENPITVNTIALCNIIGRKQKRSECLDGKWLEKELEFTFQNEDYGEIIDVSKHSFHFPLLLGPYAEQSNFIIFPWAYAPACPTGEKTVLIAITSRGERKFNFVAPTIKNRPI